MGSASSINDDLYGGYTLSSKIGRTSLDVISVVGMVIITGEVVTATAPIIGATFVASGLGELIKDAYFDKKE